MDRHAGTRHKMYLGLMVICKTMDASEKLSHIKENHLHLSAVVGFKSDPLHMVIQRMSYEYTKSSQVLQGNLGLSST